jgi:cysteine-rich repeat protein
MTRGWLVFYMCVLAACGDNLTPNRAPTAEPFTLTTMEDLSITRVIVAEDLDRDELEADIPIPPEHGQVNLNGLSLTYVPDPNYHGPDQFAVLISDGEAEVSITIDVTVESVADAPFAIDDALSTAEDVPRTVASALLLANDTDPDGDVLTVVSVDSAVNGSVALATGNVTFTPAANFSGTGSFTYTISDGALTATGTVTVVIDGANDAPTAVDDNFTTPEDTAITISELQLVGNDTDPENQVLTVEAVSGATNGTIVDNGDNTFTFTPTANFNGDAQFAYSVGDGTSTDAGLVTITVTPVNDPADAIDDGPISQTGAANAIPHATLLANDSDGGDGNALAITAVSDAVGGTVTLEATTVTFSPANGFSGNAEFKYTISDGFSTDTATVTITVTVPRICGDGVIIAPEECDDDDLTPGDGCDQNCEIEDGFECTGEPSVCVEVCNDGIQTASEPCDDGDDDDLDGCTTQCVVGRVCDVAAFPGGDRFAVDPATGHCYVSFDGTTTTFGAAQASCLASTGYLATVTTTTENDVFVTVLNPAENPWIGADEIGNDTDNIFNWVTDEDFVPATFENFATGQPDDDVGSGGTGECLHILNAAGEWNDTNCANPTSFVVGQVCEYEPSSCGDSLVQPGEECDDSNQTDGDGCSRLCQIETLYFSEYVEGTGFNKAIEIRNPSSTVNFNLAGCFMRVDFAGGNQLTFTLPPVNFLPANDVIVICNALADPAILANCDLPEATGAMNFDGDDTIALVCGGVVVDVIGDVGFDPGTEWGTGNVSTADNTLRRKCAIANGDTTETNDFEPTLAAEWAGFAVDTFDGLGSDACAP